jgi:branched-subunit amino acid permease
MKRKRSTLVLGVALAVLLALVLSFVLYVGATVERLLKEDRGNIVHTYCPERRSVRSLRSL